MEQKIKQKMSTKKKVSAAVAGVLVAALALGGAYAWTDYSQNARNTFKGTIAADVLLHDDFNGENKDVYVENTGESEVFVRVKFAEYLQIGNNSVLTAYSDGEEGTTEKANPDDVTTWPVHQFEDAVAEDNTCDLSTHDYFKWNMTGNLKTYLSGVTESNSNGYGGLSKEAFDALELNTDVPLGDITTQKKESLPASPVMMLSDWLKLETKPTEPCWLLDTDGWAYWSAALQPGTATNLLLDSVEATDVAPHDNWVYHIDVQLQAANATELDAWYVDGMKDVANPDNSIATVTNNGYNFLLCQAGEYISVGNNVYAKAILSADGTDYVSSGDYILAGQDETLGTEDDNMLAGRIATASTLTDENGGIRVRDIDLTNVTYKLEGADDDYVVTAGIDKKLGTYDDVITSTLGALGKYEIDGDNTKKENVGWNYLGGSLDNMLVATEYVLDNVKFSASSSAYAGSDIQSKIEKIAGNMNITATVNPINLDMSSEQHTGEQVIVCTKGCEEGKHSGCIFEFGNYYTETESQENIPETKFFALSIKEVLDAYGDSTEVAVRELRRVQAAPAYVYATSGQSSTGFNYNDSTTFKDGEGNAITTTNYWLRSPGYCAGYATCIYYNGNAFANINVTHGYIGARPACYLNLSADTTTQ